MSKEPTVAWCLCNGSQRGHSVLPTEGEGPHCLIEPGAPGSVRGQKLVSHRNRQPTEAEKKDHARKQRAIAKAERAVVEAATIEKQPQDSFCSECGPHVAVDEDGCCAQCGGSAMGEWASRAAAVFRACAALAALRGKKK